MRERKKEEEKGLKREQWEGEGKGRERDREKSLSSALFPWQGGLINPGPRRAPSPVTCFMYLDLKGENTEVLPAGWFHAGGCLWVLFSPQAENWILCRRKKQTVPS